MGKLRIPLTSIANLMINTSSYYGDSYEYSFMYGGATTSGVTRTPSTTAPGGKLLNPAYSSVIFYQGVMPTQSVIDSWDNGPQTDPQAADALAVFPTSNCTLTGRNIQVFLNAANAIKTGTASWFMLKAAYSLSGGSYVDVLAGSISLTGAGGDIELPDTAFTLGSNYRPPQLTLRLPTTYSF